MRPPRDTPLRRLADRVGILAEYVDQTGTERRATSDDTRRAILAAMGIDASSEQAAADALATMRAGARATLVPRTAVMGQARSAEPLVVRVPASRGRTGVWRLAARVESGARVVTEGPWRGESSLTLALPELPLGYHALRLELFGGGHEWVAEQSRIVVPPRCVTPADVLGDARVFGLTANLYTMRSDANWGVGDIRDLECLAIWAASAGADFVGINPLHALLDRESSVSPYSPVSRIFRNPLYLRIEDVPELVIAPDVRALLSSSELQARLDALRESPAVQYDQVMAVKGIVLDALHRAFVDHVCGAGSEREGAYRAYCAGAEPALSRFATWMTIGETLGDFDWRRWPADLRDARSPAVARFAGEHATRVAFHRWVQFEIDRQLAAAGASARRAGMRIGLYQDIAIGTSATGADAWAQPELFASGASIGAPPDPYSAAGQNWGLPPIVPRALQREGYRYFIDVVRSGFAHGGALRVDHVMGLFRLFWIPAGRTGVDGAYVRYPAADLLGIIALESVRHHALVVGEDLGTVPKDVPPMLQQRGVLSSKVLQFERDRRGAYRAAAKYPALALATANTHDLPTIAGFWSARDVDLRAQVGLMPASDVEEGKRERERDRRALLRRLHRDGVLPAARAPARPAELRGAVHAFLCRTPAQLVGVALDDLAGETEPVNVPGVGADAFPSWTRKMREPIETLVASGDVRAALRCDGRGRPP